MRWSRESCVQEMQVSSPARGKRVRPLHTLAARLTALRAPLPENSSDFGLLCAQVYA